jgi:CRP-like cAMP-binding protein
MERRGPSASEIKSIFLEGLTPSERAAVLKSATLRRFAANAVVTHQETLANRLFLLVEGRARYFFVTPDGQKVILFWLLPGDTFGGTTLLARPSRYPVSTETVTASTALVWDRKTIRTHATRYPRLLENQLSTASDYLVWYVATHLALTCPSARQRLAFVLSNLARGLGQGDHYSRELDVTNHELACAANLGEFTVSRFLNKWQSEGAIVKKRGKVVVTSPEKLF